VDKDLKDKEDSMSKEEAWNVLEFAQSLYSGFSGYGFYNPWTQNQNLVSLNNDSLVPTYSKIISSLDANPIDAKTLCGYSEFMKVFDTIYAKTLRYFQSLLAFDLNITCVNMKDPKEYSSDAYKQDLRRVYKFLDNFNYKQEFGTKVVGELLRKETSYVWFRDSHEIDAPIDIDSDEIKTRKNEKFSLQIMPQRYCMLTGYFNSSQLLYDFNYNYFMNGTTDINLFAPSMKRTYKELFDGDNKAYNPASQISQRNGEFATWVQCSPIDGAYAFKMSIDNFSQTPPFASLMKTCIRNTDIENLQYDKNLLGARAILAGTIRLIDNAKSGSQKNQFAIDPNTLGTLMNIVASTLNKNLDVGAMPTEDNKIYQYQETNKTMVEDSIVNSARQGASASSLIYSDEKMMQFEAQQAVETDYQFMAKLYEQFNEFMNTYLASLNKQPPSDWSKDAREWAESNEIIRGNENGEKQYKSFCTREQMVQFLHRVSKL